MIYSIARADFLERVRRSGYLITLLFAVYLGYAAGTGRISLRLGDYRGVYTSAWIGAMMSLVTSTFVSLVGFYIVKNAVDRDRQTGVGEILATTRVGKISYLAGKFCSNFSVLLSIVAVLAVAAVVMQLTVTEDRAFHGVSLLLPFFLLTMPAMAVTAAAALFFETFRLLRGGFGNVAWFFVWSFGVALPGITGIPQIDPLGIWTVYASISPAARAGIPGYTGGFALTIADRAVKVAAGFHWDGIEWTFGLVLLRVMWILAAILLTILGSPLFDRFDTARKTVSGQTTADSPPAESSRAAPGSAHLSPLSPTAFQTSLPRMIALELRLALKGYRWWWYAVAVALVLAQLFAPLAVSRGPLLAVAWLWPVGLWSALGTREKRCGIEQLLFSSAKLLPRQFVAMWAGGLLLAVATGFGAAVRLAIGGQPAGLLAWSAGALFVPSLALALGVVTGASRAFEGIYTALWYIGPMNQVPGLDFTGAAIDPLAGRYALIFFLLSGGLFTVAYLHRARQIRGA